MTSSKCTDIFTRHRFFCGVPAKFLKVDLAEKCCRRRRWKSGNKKAKKSLPKGFSSVNVDVRGLREAFVASLDAFFRRKLPSTKTRRLHDFLRDSNRYDGKQLQPVLSSRRRRRRRRRAAAASLLLDPVVFERRLNDGRASLALRPSLQTRQQQRQRPHRPLPSQNFKGQQKAPKHGSIRDQPDRRSPRTLPKPRNRPRLQVFTDGRRLPLPRLHLPGRGGRRDGPRHRPNQEASQAIGCQGHVRHPGRQRAPATRNQAGTQARSCKWS